MKYFHFLIQIINLLNQRKISSKEEICKIVGIHEDNSFEKIMKIAKFLNLNIENFFGKYFLAEKPLKFLNEEKINANFSSRKVIVIPVVDSTNQFLIKNIEKIQSGCTCTAEYQTKGRGQKGKLWNSLFGKDLCLSLYWEFKKNISEIVGLSIVVSIVIVELLQNFGVNDIRIKWPNDLYLKDKKLAGVLVESFYKQCNLTRVIIGIGINLMKENFYEKTENFRKRISLEGIGIYIDRNIFIPILLNMLYQALNQFEKYGFLIFLSKWKKLKYS